MLALEAADNDGQWRRAGSSSKAGIYRRCANFGLAPQCNWLLLTTDGEHHTLCRCCRLNRIVPDQSIAANAPLWHKVEVAKRRLVSSLIAFGLPVASRLSEDIQQGMAFDLLVEDEPLSVTTGHDDGIITVNVNEADDAAREAIRCELREPYRTLLGHVRHESGHYYWSSLLQGSRWHEPFRALFGDERQDYDAALQNYYATGPDPAWADNCVSAYASAHPWEDWAETWAHYLHMMDTLDTAKGAGMGNKRFALLKNRFDEQVLYRMDDEQDNNATDEDKEFLGFVNGWVELTSVLNEFSLGMGLPDFYPFVLSNMSTKKLHFVHRFIQTADLTNTASTTGAMT